MLIRKFEEKDIEVVAKILAIAFKEKYHKTIKVSDDKLPELLIDANLINTKPFEGYFVIEVENQVIGTMVLRWKKQKKPGHKLSFIKLVKYSWLRAITLILGIKTLSSLPKEDECYIDLLAIKPDFQGKGIGVYALEYVKSYAKNKGFKKLLNCVAVTNHGAINLSKKVGFQTIKLTKNRITNYFFGINKWYYMRLDL